MGLYIMKPPDMVVKNLRNYKKLKNIFFITCRTLG